MDQSTNNPRKDTKSLSMQEQQIPNGHKANPGKFNISHISEEELEPNKILVRMRVNSKDQKRRSLEPSGFQSKIRAEQNRLAESEKHLSMHPLKTLEEKK